MFSHAFFLWALGLLFAIALFMAGAYIRSRFREVQVGLGFVFIVLCAVGIANTLIKSSHPSWATVRPVVEEAAAFRHDPPAITVIWQRLKTGHRLTETQWVAFRYWVNRKQKSAKEASEKRLVERIAADHLRALARKVPHSRTSKAR